MFLDLGRGSSVRVMVGSEAGPAENHWSKVLFRISRHRFIIGKEEIPAQAAAVDPAGSRPAESGAAVEAECSEAEQQRSRRKTLVSRTRELLEAM